MQCNFGFDRLVFSDGCTHIQLHEDAIKALSTAKQVHFKIRYEHKTDSLDDLIMLKSALTGVIEDSDVHIHFDIVFDFLPYARQDRICAPGQANGLFAFLKAVVMAGPETNVSHHITTFDVHNEVNTRRICEALQASYTNISVSQILKVIGSDRPTHIQQITRSAGVGNVFLVSPDKGALPRVTDVLDHSNLANVNPDIIVYRKKRDPKTGKIISIETDDLNKPFTSHTVFIIIDDICDGGGTFIPMIKQLSQHGQVFMWITHGLFSNGVDVLFENGLTGIWTTSTVFDSMLHYDKDIACFNPETFIGM